jgi:uncharacterized protein YecE (DUF72 family)
LISAIAQNNGYIGLIAMEVNNSFYSGTSGLVVPVPQKLFPAAFKNKSRLEFYASMFNSIEINSSFYKNPKASTVQKWASLVPDHFRFTFKMSKTVTHAKELLYNKKDVVAFLNLINAVGKKKGCILLQFPPSTRSDKLNELQKLLHDLAAAILSGWRIAIEFRHASWYNNDVYAILQQLNIAIVDHDIPASATPATTMTTGIRYLRFHGENGRYRGGYTDAELQQHAARIHQWIGSGQMVYVYFNNTMGDALKNLQTLNRFVDSYD